MSEPLKQHLIDPEICIRCHTCEEACSLGAITHNDDNVVVDAAICTYCMDCIAPCPTGSIDNWRVVSTPYSLDEQFEWLELPEQEELQNDGSQSDTSIEAFDTDVAALLEEAHKGAGGVAAAPASASKPVVNLFSGKSPLQARVQGNFRLTSEDADSDVRHIILDLGTSRFPVLEGQSIGITPPGTDASGKPHRLRLYTVSSPRDGERANTNNLSLTVKREENGVCSNFICDLERDAEIDITGPFGASFLLPNDAASKLLMICTGTGAAPFRAFTMNRQRTSPNATGTMKLFFGARSPDALPYFGPLKKIPDSFLQKHFAFSRQEGFEKTYVQDLLRKDEKEVSQWLQDPDTHIYLCGLKAMEAGVEEVLRDIAQGAGLDWEQLKSDLLLAGRYHVETY